MDKQNLAIMMAASSSVYGAIKEKFTSKEEKHKSRNNFVKAKNLETIARFALDEKRELKYLLSGAYKDEPYINAGEAMEEIASESHDIARMARSVMPIQKAHTKKDMEAILEEIKPHFYGISGINQIKDPELRIMPSTRLRFALELFSPAVPGIALISTIASGIYYLFSSDLAVSVSIGAAVASLLAAPRLAVAYSMLKDAKGLALPPSFMDRIYISKADRHKAFSDIAHEYTHNACYKCDSDMENSFMAEGFATALGDRILMGLGKKYPHLEVYARQGRLSFALQSFGLMLSHFTGKVPEYMGGFPFYVNPSIPAKKRIESNNFNYVGGSTMVNIAEYKYGLKIYKEFFQKNYTHFA